jgi:hypothetical protein
MRDVRTHGMVSSEMPTQVRRAVVLLWAAFSLTLLESVITLLTLDHTDFELWMGGLLFGAFLLNAGIIYFVSRRRNWARFVLLIFTVAIIASYLAFPESLDTEVWWSIATVCVTTLMEIVALFWLFFGRGAEWYGGRAA